MTLEILEKVWWGVHQQMDFNIWMNSSQNFRTYWSCCSQVEASLILVSQVIQMPTQALELLLYIVHSRSLPWCPRNF